MTTKNTRQKRNSKSSSKSKGAFRPLSQFNLVIAAVVIVAVGALGVHALSSSKAASTTHYASLCLVKPKGRWCVASEGVGNTVKVVNNDGDTIAFILHKDYQGNPDYMYQIGSYCLHAVGYDVKLQTSACNPNNTSDQWVSTSSNGETVFNRRTGRYLGVYFGATSGNRIVHDYNPSILYYWSWFTLSQ